MDDIPALIKRLEAGLEGVTPGPWYSEGTAVFFDTRKLSCCGKGVFECCGNPDIDGDYGPVAETSETAARHIANCDPDTIRTLLSALQAQAAEIERLREERENAQSTLSAWFDLSKKAEDAGASILEAALDTWLRRASSGGMPSEHADIVRNVVTDAARLYLWHALVPVLRTLDEEREARLAEAVEVMRRVEPYLDAIICYASTMDEHEPNRIAAEFRAFLATMEKSDE